MILQKRLSDAFTVDVCLDRLIELKTSVVCCVDSIPNVDTLHPDEAVIDIGVIIPTLTYTPEGWVKLLTYQVNDQVGNLNCERLELKSGATYRVSPEAITAYSAVNELFNLTGENRLVPVKLKTAGSDVMEDFLVPLSVARKRIAGSLAEQGMYLWLATPSGKQAEELFLMPSLSKTEIVLPYGDRPRYGYALIECLTPL